jgi:hypothetical protein
LERLQGQKKDLLALKAMLEDMEDEEATVNMSDPEAKVMKHKDGRSLPSYNHQSAVDGKMGVVVAVSTTNESDKPADLFSLVDRAKDNAGQGHENVLADPGFCDYETLKQAECEREEEYYLPDLLRTLSRRISSRCAFKLFGAEVAQVRMQPPSVVEHLDVLEELPPRLLASLEDPIPDQFRLQAGQRTSRRARCPSSRPCDSCFARSRAPSNGDETLRRSTAPLDWSATQGPGAVGDAARSRGVWGECRSKV